MTGYKEPPPWHHSRPRTIAQQYNHMLRSTASMQGQLSSMIWIAMHNRKEGELSAGQADAFIQWAQGLRMELDNFTAAIRDTRALAIEGARAKGKTKGVGRL